MKTEIDTRAELKGLGKLSRFMSKTITATSPPHEGEPMGIVCQCVFHHDFILFILIDLFIFESVTNVPLQESVMSFFSDAAYASRVFSADDRPDP